MSRLGDLIRTERIRQKMTPKQVAKKCGVSESFILAVEAGTRIIADDQARRILKTIGLREQTEADFTLDDIAATVDLQTVQPAMVKKPAAPKVEKVASTEETPAEGVAGSVWLDALMARSCWWNTAPTAPCARSKSWTASKCSCNPMTGSTTRKPWRSPT